MVKWETCSIKLKWGVPISHPINSTNVSCFTCFVRSDWGTPFFVIFLAYKPEWYCECSWQQGLNLCPYVEYKIFIFTICQTVTPNIWEPRTKNNKAKAVGDNLLNLIPNRILILRTFLVLVTLKCWWHFSFVDI